MIGRAIVMILSIVSSLFIMEATSAALVSSGILAGIISSVNKKVDLWKTDTVFALSKSRIYTPRVNMWYDTQWRTDQDAFRYNPLHKEDREKVYSPRILAIGDSFTYGHGVGPMDAYPAALERILLNAFPSVRIDNAGVSGYGIDQEYLYIQEILKRRDYDVILWNININDVSDTDDMCLFRNIFGTYIQFPAWMNIFYLTLFQSRTTNPYIQNSKSSELVLMGIRAFLKRDRFTFGCSRIYQSKFQENIVNDFEDKVTHFNTELIRTLRTKGKYTTIMYLLMPFRHDFIADDTNGEIKDVRKLADRMDLFMSNAQLNYMNASRAIAKVFKRDLSVMQSNPNILGINSRDIADVLFLNEERFGNYSHMSKDGNTYLAQVVAAWLQEVLQN